MLSDENLLGEAGSSERESAEVGGGREDALRGDGGEAVRNGGDTGRTLRVSALRASRPKCAFNRHQERLCRKLEETDIERSLASDELRQCYLRLETVRQEKKVSWPTILTCSMFRKN